MTNFSGNTASISNRFAYDAAGNRASEFSTYPALKDASYRGTVDNQLTGIYWDSSKVTLGGIIENTYSADWVKVKQSTDGTYTTAKYVNRRGYPVQWMAYDVPVSGSGSVLFDIQALVLNAQTVNGTASYTKASSGSGTIKFIYDANGNRTGRVQAVAGGFLATTYDYDADNQLTRIREWSNGVSRFDYQYDYDPFGRRIKAVEGGVTRYFVYDGLDCVAELDANKNLTKYYTRGLGLGGGIGDIVAEWRPSATNWYSYNHRGDVTLLTANGGRVTHRAEYTAFGSPSTIDYQLSTRSIGFSSKEYDTKSGLGYYGFRYYDAHSGRWMTKDPILWAGGLNLYLLSSNRPLTHSDPYGLRACNIVTIIGHGQPPPGPSGPKDSNPMEDRNAKADRFGFLGCFGERYNQMIPEAQRIPKRPIINRRLYDLPLVFPPWNLESQANAMWDAMKAEAKSMCDDPNECCDSVTLLVEPADEDGWYLAGWKHKTERIECKKE